MDNAYKRMTFYKAFAHALDIHQSGLFRFAGNPNLGTGTLFISGINEVWKLTKGFYRYIKKTKSPLRWRV